jgi:hypothetical protein
MSTLDNLLDAVKTSITNHVEQGGHTGFDTGGLLSKITDLFSSHKRAAPDPRNPRPAAEDPYGDPANAAGGRNIRPASQDPYGDPADQPPRR